MTRASILRWRGRRLSEARILEYITKERRMQCRIELDKGSASRYYGLHYKHSKVGNMFDKSIPQNAILNSK